jgi:DNA-binding CsgD family transcriptional regulator/tetratricopeptide (TPR) repeat protein
MPLLERAEALGSLAEYAGSAAEGQGRLVLVAGEAGVGKTALVEEFQRVQPQLRWLWGACDGLFTPRPLAPVFDIADSLGGELLDACRRGAPRDELFGLLLAAMREGPGVTAVIVEDVHWADESTLDLLRFLGRRIRSCPAVLLVTYRDDGPADDPLRVTLGELAALSTTRRVSLPPLSERAVRQLAEASGRPADELYRLTGGNPFFVTEVLRASSEALPPSAADAVLARAARLGRDARHALDCAALIGTRTEPEVLGDVAGCGPQVLDEIVSSGLMVAEASVLRFRHELGRRAVEAAIPAHRRAAVHARILASLREHACQDDARLAHHAEAAGDVEAVLAFAPAAARRASALLSHREAAAQYERALRFAGTADAATRAALYDALADEDGLIDRFEAAAEARQQALALWQQEGNALRAGNAMRELSRTCWRLCRGPEGDAMAQAALDTLEPLGPTPELARAYGMWAAVRFGHDDLDGALYGARRAHDLAATLGLPGVQSWALNLEGIAVYMRGGDGLEIVRRGLDLALESDAAEDAARSYTNVHEILIGTRRLSESVRCFEEGIAYCEQHDMGTYVTCLRGWHANALEMLGRWDDAAAICAQTLATVSSPVNRLTSLVALGRILARRGDPAAWDYLDEAIRNATTLDEGAWIVFAGLARAEAHWLAGDDEAARAQLAAIGEPARRQPGWSRGSFAVWVRRTGSPLHPAVDDIPEPYAELLHRDPSTAARMLDRLGLPYEAALALFDSHTEDGMRDALRRFESLGAVAAVELARRAMRAHGIKSIPVGPRAATREHPLGLTRREREVLELVCAGRTNAEISAELFISSRTVDHHVSAVLGKLGTATRTGAAAEAARLGLVAAAEK